ncbi:MAG TPA: GrlR family regulatory protein [Terriglobales bacterium]|nr:GrlR family regulatory protein [Terriglobales bacterium]
MVEGLWIVQYEGSQGNGGGVAVFMKGRILGGDTGFVYTGNYRAEGKNLSGQVKVSNFLPGIPSVLGISGDFELRIVVVVDGNTMKGTGSLVGNEGSGVALKLTKVSDLPVS